MAFKDAKRCVEAKFIKVSIGNVILRDDVSHCRSDATGIKNRCSGDHVSLMLGPSH